MIQEPLVFLLILVISLIMSHFLLGDDKPKGFRLVMYWFFFLGVIFHELSHYLMCLMTGMKPEQIKVKWRNERFRFRDPHGSVKPSRTPTFLQAFVSGIAPLVFSTWAIFGLLFAVVSNSDFFFQDSDTTVFIKSISVVLIVSFLMTAAPSTGDWQYITASFRENTSHSWYQVLLVSVSISILWFILNFTQITFFLDVFYYLSIAGIYLALKFSLIGSKKLIINIGARNYSKPSKVRMRPFTHKHYKPKKPPKRL